MRVLRYGDDTGGVSPGGTVLTAGTFDGVHVGHQQIIGEIVDRASTDGLTSAVLTLDQHPSEIVAPHRRVELLTTLDKRLDIIAGLGVDTAFIMDFSPEVAAMSAESFVENIVAGWCAAKQVLIGHDYRFGAGRTGNETLLRRMGETLGFTVDHVPPVLLDGVRVSSTVVRECVVAGRLGDAWRFLGRPYMLSGQVIQGRGLGRELGFPTTNIMPHNRVMPPDGVYAARVTLENGATMPAAVNIGLRPSLESNDNEIARLVEAFILGFDNDLYGQSIDVAFWQYLRPERKFHTVEDLQDRIATDVEDVRRLMEGEMPYEAEPPEPRRHAQRTGE